MAKKDEKGVSEQEADSIYQAQPKPTQVLESGAKDDFDVTYQSPTPPVEEIKPSIISRFFSYISTKVQSTMNTTTGKVLFGTAASRTITILFAVSVISGVWPPAIPFAVTAGVMSLTAVAVSAIVDTVKTRSLRKLAEESDLLGKNRNAISRQEYILQTLSPELADILKDQLHNRQNPQQQNQQQGNNNPDVGAAKALNVSQMMSDSVPTAANFALQTMVATSTGNPLIILNSIRTGVTTAATLISGGVNAKYMVDVATALKMYIKEEHSNAGEYRTIQDLRRNVEKQEIQTLAIQKLLQEKDYFKFTPQEKKEKFEELTKTINNAVETYSTLPPQQKQEQFNKLPEELQQIVSHPVTKSESILSDARRAHDPFYEHPTNRAPDSELTKAMASEKAKESAKSIITPKVKEHLVSPKKSKHKVPEESFDKSKYKVSQESSKILDAELSKVSQDLSKGKKASAHLDLADSPSKHNKRTAAHPEAAQNSSSKAKEAPKGKVKPPILPSI